MFEQNTDATILSFIVQNCPVFYFTKEEQNFPLNVEQYMKKCQLKHIQSPHDIFCSSIQNLFLEKRYLIQGKTRSPLTDKDFYLNPSRKISMLNYLSKSVVYARLTVNETYIRISYMFFFKENEGTQLGDECILKHQGDWKHCALYFDKVNQELTHIVLDNHLGESRVIPSDLVEYETISNQYRPIIYVSCGTHSLYASKGTHLQPIHHESVKEYTSKDKRWIPRNIVFLPETLQRARRTKSTWIYYKGRYSQDEVYGPVYKQWWNQDEEFIHHVSDDSMGQFKIRQKRLEEISSVIEETSHKVQSRRNIRSQSETNRQKLNQTLNTVSKLSNFRSKTQSNSNSILDSTKFIKDTDELIQTQQKLKNETETIQNEKETIQQQFKQLKEEKQQFEKDKELLKREKDELKNQETQISLDYQTISQQKVELETRNDKLDQKRLVLNQTQDEIEREKKELTRCKQDVETLRQKEEHLRQREIELQQERDRLCRIDQSQPHPQPDSQSHSDPQDVKVQQQKLYEKEQELSQIQQEITHKSNELQLLEQDLLKLINEIKEKEDLMKLEQEEFEKSKQDISTRRIELQELSKTLETRQSTLDEWNKTLTQKEQELLKNQKEQEQLKAEYTELKQQEITLKEREKELENKVQELETLVNQIQEKTRHSINTIKSTYEKKLNKLKEQLNQRETRIQRLKHTSKQDANNKNVDTVSLKREKELQEKVKQLYDELDTQINILNETRSELETKNIQIEHIEKNILDQDVVNEQNMSIILKVSRTIQNRDKLVVELQNDISNLKDQIQSANKTKEQSEEELKRIQLEITTVQDKYQEEIDTKLQTEKEWTDMLDSLQSHVVELKQTIHKRDQTIQELKLNGQKMNDSIKHKDIEQRKLQKQINILSKEREEIRKSLRQKVSEHEKTLHSYHQVKKELDDTVKQFTASKEQYQQEKEELLANHEREIKTLNELIQTHQHTISEQSKSLEQKRIQLETQKKELESKLKEMTNRADVDKVRFEMEQYKSIYDELVQTQRDTKVKLIQLQEKYDTLQKEKTTLHTQLNEWKQYANKLDTMVREKEQKYKRMSEQIALNQTHQHSSRKVEFEFEMEKQQLKKELNQFKEKLKQEQYRREQQTSTIDQIKDELQKHKLKSGQEQHQVERQKVERYHRQTQKHIIPSMTTPPTRSPAMIFTQNRPQKQKRNRQQRRVRG